MCKICEKLAHDFETMLENMPENYTTQQLESLAHLAMVLQVKNKICKDGEVNDYPMITQRENQDHTEEELHDAEKYYTKFMETHDQNYKQMAKDELRHADFFLKHERMTNVDPMHQQKLQGYTEWYNNLLTKLNSGNPY